MKVVTVEVGMDAKSLPVVPSERGSRILKRNRETVEACCPGVFRCSFQQHGNNLISGTQ